MRHTAPQAVTLPAAAATEENGNERQAAILGDTTAQHSIAEAYLREIRNENPEASDERLSKAARWFRRAAEGGHISAQYRLATLYELGHGVPQSYAEAMKWYERAAIGGHTKAMHNLGVLAVSAATQKPDYQKAAYWFGKAAESGLRDSQYNLAILNENGLGVKKDIRGALRWYTAAALQGDTKAAEKRDEILRARPALGQTVRIAYPKASKWTTVTANVVGGKDDHPSPAAPLPKPQAVLKQPAAKAVRKNGGWSAQLTHINDTILTAQELLLQLGFQPGRPDGIFGPRTMAAIRAYQEKAGLPQTGNLSDALLIRMEAELAS
jgi:localization factor PodJL